MSRPVRAVAAPSRGRDRMKKILLLSVLLMPPACARAQAADGPLPPAVGAALDKKFPGWKFAEVRQDIRRYLSEHVSPDARGDMIRGDFDGNGEQDYALLIRHGDVKNAGGSVSGPEIHAVAFLKKGRRYRYYHLRDGAGEYLALVRKGEKGYEYGADRHFRYARDAVFSGHFEKGGVSFVFEKGKFRSMVTSD